MKTEAIFNSLDARRFAPYQVCGLKSLRTYDGIAWTAKLKRDGKVVAEVGDDGNGGPVYSYFKGEAERLAFGDFAKAKGESADILLSSMADLAENVARFRRHCAKKTLFFVEGDKPGEFRTIARAYDAGVRQAIASRYGEGNFAVLNDFFSGGAA